MRERAEELGAHLSVRTREGAGTEVELRIPADAAFRHPVDGPGRGWRARLSALRSGGAAPNTKVVEKSRPIP